MRALLSTLAIVLAVGLVPAAAEAACTKTGTLVRVKMKDDSQTGSHVLYLRELATDPFHWTAKTKDDELAQSASGLVASRTRVQVKGDKSACPSAPASGGASIGGVIQLVTSP